MKVAVLMSTYNGDEYLKEQIESILGQKGDFELTLIVRDDGSIDGTQHILSEYEGKKQLQWYQGDNKGPAHSFWDLILNTHGFDFYAFADQDDFWEEDKIYRALISMHNKNADVYCCNALMVDQQLCSIGRPVYRVPPKTDFYTITCAGGILGCTLVFSSAIREIICENMMPQNIIMHDFYLCLLSVSIGKKLVYDEFIGLKYRLHGRNVVGVSKSKLQAIYELLNTISNPIRVSIAEQANDILECYGSIISEEKKNWLKVISLYRKSLFTRMSLALTKKTKYSSLNSSIRNRLTILFGKR